MGDDTANVTGETGFPSLKPSLVMKVNVGEANPIGEVSNGSNLLHIAANSGTIKSIPGSGLDLDFQIVFGGDWLYFDADKGRARLNVRGVAKDTEGVPVSFMYTGTILMNEGASKVFSYSPEAKTIPFGASTTIHTFESGHPKYKFLENKSWVGNGRFVVHPEGVLKGLIVESRVSEVDASTDMD
ncbi:MAG: hypothetical protein Q9203_002632 [Teloschistes exilis]